MDPTMTPQQALEVIDNVLAQVQLPRQGHAQLMEAVQVLQQVILQEAPSLQAVVEELERKT